MGGRSKGRIGPLSLANCTAKYERWVSDDIGEVSSSRGLFNRPFSYLLQIMNPRPPRPESERPLFISKQDVTQTPERCQRHVVHDRGNEPVRGAPLRDETGQAVAREILDDGDVDEDGTRGGFLRVDGWEGCYLDAGIDVADDDDCLN